jgi:hypothetical protein
MTTAGSEGPLHCFHFVLGRALGPQATLDLALDNAFSIAMTLFPKRWCLALTCCLASSFGAFAHSPALEMAEAAGRFLAALTPEQKAQCTFAMTDTERHNWHFVPRARKGVAFKDFSPAQRQLAHALIASSLSHRGYVKATTIISLEEILRELEQGRGPVRDPELYYVTIFGEPGKGQAWGWRLEGHHLSLNFTLAPDDQVSVTPSFFGSNPAEVRTGPRRGLRVLAAEEDLARDLVRSLDSGHQRIAIYTDKAPADVITAADRKARVLDPAGLSAARMSAGQRAILLALIKEYIYRYRPELADQDLLKIQAAGFENLTFAWAGSTERGQGHYYRVQGPSFLLEYDNTQNSANHVHTVWRDLDGDFGEDLLRKHYDQDHQQR